MVLLVRWWLLHVLQGELMHLSAFSHHGPSLIRARPDGTFRGGSWTPTTVGQFKGVGVALGQARLLLKGQNLRFAKVV